jgi:hypothetical protein
VNEQVPELSYRASPDAASATRDNWSHSQLVRADGE